MKRDRWEHFNTLQQLHLTGSGSETGCITGLLLLLPLYTNEAKACQIRVLPSCPGAGSLGTHALHQSQVNLSSRTRRFFSSSSYSINQPIRDMQHFIIHRCDQNYLTLTFFVFQLQLPTRRQVVPGAEITMER